MTKQGPDATPPNTHESMHASLLLRLQGDDDSAWQRLDQLYGPVVLGWCRGSGLQAEDAADVRQEVFRSVAGAIAGFRRDKAGDSFRGWLWRITGNKIRDCLRRRQRQPQAAGGTAFQRRLHEIPLSESTGDETSPPKASAEEIGGVYRRALEMVRGEFAERTWQAFWEVAIDGRSPADVAAELGMSAGAIYVAKSRILRRLREEFGEVLE